MPSYKGLQLGLEESLYVSRYLSKNIKVVGVSFYLYRLLAPHLYCVV
jgi:hypothetical protein